MTRQDRRGPLRSVAAVVACALAFAVDAAVAQQRAESTEESPLAAEESPLAKVTREMRQTALADLGADRVFDMLDTNADGELSRAEAAFDVELRKRFQSVDTDSDLRVSSDEYAQFHEAELARSLDEDL